MKVTVIGASSFTGRAFCELARERGADLREESLRNLRALSAELQEPQEYVVNFAALNVVAPSWQYPSDYLYTNAYATLAVFDILAHKPLLKFVQVSTPEVYGSTAGWVKEEAPYNPSTPYAVSRACADMMLKAYCREHGFPGVITRACNIYGPGQQLYRLIPKMIASVKRGERFPLEGGGKSTRAFVHVRDCVDAIWRVMVDGVTGTSYHISSREQQSIEAIVRFICARLLTKFEDAVELVPERPGKDAAYMIDSGRIRAELGWEDRISMDAGIDEVIAWMTKEWDNLKGESLEYQHRP